MNFWRQRFWAMHHLVSRSQFIPVNHFLSRLVLCYLKNTYFITLYCSDCACIVLPARHDYRVKISYLRSGTQCVEKEENE